MTNRYDLVVIGDKKFALHLLPSGILTPEVVPVIGNGVVIDAGVLFTEIDNLEAQGVEVEVLLEPEVSHRASPSRCNRVPRSHAGFKPPSPARA